MGDRYAVFGVVYALSQHIWGSELVFRSSKLNVAQKNATVHPDDPGLRVFNEARFCLFINPITWCDETSLPNTAEPEKEINNGKHKVLTDSR